MHGMHLKLIMSRQLHARSRERDERAALLDRTHRLNAVDDDVTAI